MLHMAIGQLVKKIMHHASEFPFGGNINHSLNALGFSGPLDNLPGVSFEVLPHSVNKHQLHIAARV
jgi:hypothetical protein